MSDSSDGVDEVADWEDELDGAAVERVREDERSRAVLKVLEESDGGRAGTSVIRERTGLSSRQVHYQYEKLVDAGLIEEEYDADATPRGVSPMKVAVLTEKGEAAVARGLSGDTADVTEETVEDRVAALEENLEENREALEDVYEWIRKTRERLGRIEERLDAVSGEDVSEMRGGDDEFEWRD